MGQLISALGNYSGILTLLLMILCVVLLVITLSLQMSMKRLDRKYRSFMKGADGGSIEKELLKSLKRIDKFAKVQDDYQEELDRIRAVQTQSLHKYGAVKYDAFDDVGGKLSFVLALLDDNDSGIVLNAVHSKENCFLYVKEILKGESYIMLSDEEIQALRIAKRYGSEELGLD